MDRSVRRPPPVTYGKLSANRRKLSNAFGNESRTVWREDCDEVIRVNPPLLELPSSMSTASKAQTTGSQHGASMQQRQLKPPMRGSSGNGKLSLGRANSISEIEVKDQKVFDVPSSDEDTSVSKPKIRRALSNPRKRTDLEENRLPSTDRNERGRLAFVGEESKPPHPISNKKQMPINCATGSKVIARSRPLSETSIPVIGRGVSGGLPGKTAPALGSAPGGGSTEEGRRKRVAQDSKRDFTGPVIKNVPLHQLKVPRESKFLKKEIPATVSKDIILPKPVKPGKNAKEKQENRSSSNPPVEDGSLYISPVTERPDLNPAITVPRQASSMKRPSLWDGFMEGADSEESDSDGKPTVKKAKCRKFDLDMESRSTLAQRRMFLDRLEVPQAARRPKAHVLELNVGADNDSQRFETQRKPLTPNLQALSEGQEIDDMEESSVGFQRGVNARQNSLAFPQQNTRVTYARQRSFLTEEIKEGVDPFADPLLPSARLPGKGLRNAPALEKDDEEDPGPGMMKSLHELREAGVNKRFLDSVEGYFEDIEGNIPIGQKRIGYLELATKLREKAFLQKFRANNFERRLLKDFGKQEDETVRFILCFIVWNFLEEDNSSQILQLVHKKGIIPIVGNMLDSSRDIRIIAKEKRTNMSKASQSLLSDFCELVKTSKVFGGKAPKALSLKILALALLDSVVKGLRSAGWVGDCLSPILLQKLVKALEPLQATVDIEKRKQVDPLFIGLPVSILESHSIGSLDSREVQLPCECLDTLANIVPGIMQLEKGDFKPIQLLILRLHINLTNRRPSICDVFSKSTVILTLVSITNSKFVSLGGSLGEAERLVQLDMLVLSLALMINFAEMSDSARLRFVEGPYETSPLSTLLNLFLERVERAAEVDSMEESQSNVAFGYLSILLGNLCQNARVRNTVRSKMPKATLEPLLSAIQEFVSHNQKVDEERSAFMGGEDNNWHRGFTEMLEQVAIKLRRVENSS